MAVKNPELGGAGLMGNVPISTAARVATLDCALDDLGLSIPRGNADMVIDYAAERFERGEINGAFATLRSGLNVDYIGALRLAAVMHTEKED